MAEVGRSSHGYSQSLLAAGLLGVGGAETAPGLGAPVLLSVTVSPTVASAASGRHPAVHRDGSLLRREHAEPDQRGDVVLDPGDAGVGVQRRGIPGPGQRPPPWCRHDHRHRSFKPAHRHRRAHRAPRRADRYHRGAGGDVGGRGATQQFTATGLLSDGSTQNLTNEVTRSSAEATLASASNVLGSQGLARLLPGADTITATDPSSRPSGTPRSPCSPPCYRHHVAAAGDVGRQGATQQFMATGLLPDGSTQNLTDEVTWSSTQATLASVSNAADPRAGERPPALGLTRSPPPIRRAC